GFGVAVSMAICLSAVAAMTYISKPAAKPLAARLDELLLPDDRVVMLGRIQYDLNFYLRTADPAWVVADWDAADLRETDNWRKELFEAASFAPASADNLLVRQYDLVSRLCSLQDGNVWLVRGRSALDAVPGLE